MEILPPNTVHFTPPVEHLLPFTQLKCSQPDCESIFTNSGNLDMHLQKHHKLPLATVRRDNEIKIFYCPEVSCVYNVSQGKQGKNFKCLKYLRQHYQKVHATKSHICTHCGKQFTTPGLLKSHLLHTCGKKFICPQCGWQYDTREALLSHKRRKGHDAPEEKKTNETPKVAIPRLKVNRSSDRRGNQHKETQTEVGAKEKELKVTSAQTDNVLPSNTPLLVSTSTSTYTSPTDELHALLCDIETQTETCSSDAALLDQMLAHSSHMYTQTCDDFLSELGLADIQTQTNWSNLDIDGTEKPEFTTDSPGGAHDELLVSTETQTSFTQCLLDSCSTTTNDAAGESAFNGLYNTQHTQTCDTLLERLFGAQESDFMGSFQSTYTQT